jgi:hypothetical protein
VNRAKSRCDVAVFALALVASVCQVSCGAKVTSSQPRVDMSGLPVVPELPDPFLLSSGNRITSQAQWPLRREELKEIFAYYEYGHMPPAPGNVAATEVSSTSLYAGATTKTVVRLSMGPSLAIRFDVNLYIPAGKTGPFPVVVTGDLGWGSLIDKVGWGPGELVDRGYVIAEFDRTALQPDEDGAVGQCRAAYPSHDWAALAVWAWGYQRVVDYLVTAPFVDRAKIAVTGHSRGGKACLIAGAFDERIALTAPNASGCGGASAFRFAIGVPTAETLGAITSSFPFWFDPLLAEFAGQEARLPFDQHELIALVAPRAFLSTNALGDAWANPEGAARTQIAAHEVFDYLAAADRIGIHYRQGTHEQSHEDWQALIDFCDQALLGKAVARSFTSVPYSGLAKGYGWSRPDN